MTLVLSASSSLSESLCFVLFHKANALHFSRVMKHIKVGRFAGKRERREGLGKNEDATGDERRLGRAARGRFCH